MTPEQWLERLAIYQLLPRLEREVLLDAAIVDIGLTAEEQAGALARLWASEQLSEANDREAWLVRHRLSLAQAQVVAERRVRIEKFKEATFAARVEGYFLQRKPQLDRVIYSLLRTRDAGIAQELFFRIQEGESTFADLARSYSQGPEATSGGLLGPYPLSLAHPQLAELLSRSQPGQLWPPRRLGEWLVIVRLEKLIPARLDEAMRRQLRDELCEQWLNERTFAKANQNAPAP